MCHVSYTPGDTASPPPHAPRRSTAPHSHRMSTDPEPRDAAHPADLPLSFTRTFAFDAAHMLAGVPDDDPAAPCANVHGHRFKLRVEVAAPRQVEGPHRGMVTLGDDLKGRVNDLVVDLLDHAFILSGDEPKVLRDALRQIGSDVIEIGRQTTVENIASWIFDILERDGLPVRSVTLWETPNQYATVRA